MLTKDRKTEAEIRSWLLSRGRSLAEIGYEKHVSNVADAAAREAHFLSEYERIAQKVFKSIPKPSRIGRKKHTKIRRELHLVLSDLHFGANLSAEEVPLKYGPQEEARRTAAVVKQVCEYKRQYRDQTILNVNLIGDIIQNQLHDARDGSPLAIQAASAQWILAQAIFVLAQEFPAGVVVRCTTGNHGRNIARHTGRATNEKWDSIETIIYHGLKMATFNISNVRFEIPKTPYYTYDTFGKTLLFTHGDSVINPGYPNRAINVANVNNQINNLIVGKERFKNLAAVTVGHVHVGTMVRLASNIVFICNGALIPTDAYAQSIGIFGTNCGQYVWESVQKHAVGDSRFIAVDHNTDKDKSLDKIIRPFPGL